jgi:pilus assembly protein Flp/PilA
VLKLLRALKIDRKGATAVEYGLIVSLIVLAMLASLNGVANATIGMWDHISETAVAAMGNS